jgi:hypothetical protein
MEVGGAAQRAGGMSQSTKGGLEQLATISKAYGAGGGSLVMGICHLQANAVQDQEP